MSDVKRVVVSVLRGVGEIDAARAIDDGDLIGEDLGIDSLARIDVVVQIERHFGVVFDEAELIDVRTVGDLCSVVENTISRSAVSTVAEA